jgi:CBS domain containing-hemolysin-like protein
MIQSILILTLLVLLSGFFSASETAFTSLSVFQIQALKKRRPEKGKLIERLRNRSDIFLTTILIGNNIVNIAASAIMTELTIRSFGSTAVGISAGILTLVILIVGEVTPKRLAINHNIAFCAATVEIILFLSYVLRPFIYLIGAVSFFLSRLTGPVKGQKLTLEGILHIVDLAEDSGVLENDKTRMMKSILRFSDVTVGAIMTHRTEVFSLRSDEKIGEVLERVRAERYSRIPVYEDHPENIVGVVLGKEIWGAYFDGQMDTPLREIMIPPVFFSQNMSVYRLISVLKKEKLNLVIVLDEYGGLAGIVTYEDVIEEIIGEIYDEDEEKLSEKITALPDGGYRILGDTPLYVINDVLDLEIPLTRGTRTLAGYLAEITGTLPQKDEVFETEMGDFVIERILRKRIVSVRFVPARPAD